MFSFLELKKLAASGGEASVSIVTACDTSSQFLAIALKGVFAARGTIVSVDETRLPSSVQSISSRKAKAIVVHWAAEKWREQFQPSFAEERAAFLRELCAGTSAAVICLLAQPLADGVFGSFAAKVPSSFPASLNAFRASVLAMAQKVPNLHVVDLALVAGGTLFSPALFASAEVAIGLDALPFVAERVADVIFAQMGRSRKCLVLDLDGTCWGGIAAEDGPEKLDALSFRPFQSWCKRLKERGIILAVCSKNNDFDAKEPFSKTPGMILSLDDFACFIANWKSKPENLRNIAETLGIGLESMVFLDDSPVERAAVRAAFTEVCVPELPVAPEERVQFLADANLFEAAGFTEEDAARAQMYRAKARAEALRSSLSGEEEFLQSLQMVAKVEKISQKNAARAAQLVQRSNQFNLRLVRHTESELLAMAEETGRFALFAFTLADRFGDNGLVAVAVLEKEETSAQIETWVESCRVLQRGLEKFVMRRLTQWCRENGVSTLRAETVAGPKNSQVAPMLAELGFRNGTLEIASAPEYSCHIKEAA